MGSSSGTVVFRTPSPTCIRSDGPPELPLRGPIRPSVSDPLPRPRTQDFRTYSTVDIDLQTMVDTLVPVQEEKGTGVKGVIPRSDGPVIFVRLGGKNLHDLSIDGFFRTSVVLQGK